MPLKHLHVDMLQMMIHSSRLSIAVSDARKQWFVGGNGTGATNADNLCTAGRSVISCTRESRTISTCATHAIRVVRIRAKDVRHPFLRFPFLHRHLACRVRKLCCIYMGMPEAQ